MKPNNDQTIATVGAGLIGQSWSASFIASGYSIRVFDPSESIADVLRQRVPSFVRQIKGCQDVSDQEVMARFTLCGSLEECVDGVAAMQESGPEKKEFKIDTFATAEKHAPKDALLLSSSSGMPPSAIAEKMQDRGRCLVGHPFNPPHILPLVEICGHEETSHELKQRAFDFYKNIGKRPVILKKAVPGFVANRLQCVLALEAVRLVDQGVVDIKDLDSILTSSLGIRWASVGPLLAGHLGGGEKGLGGIITHILNSLAKGMGVPPIPDETAERLGQLALEAYPKEKAEDYARLRDAMQDGIIELQEKILHV